MVSMKMSATEAEKYAGGPAMSAGDAPMYPYGLCLSLNNESLKKLGITNPPAVGTKFQLSAIVEVTGFRQNKEHDGDTNSNAEMQITDMEIAPHKGEIDAASLYPASNHAK